MTWIDVTDVIEFLETEPLVTAVQRVAVDLTAPAAYRRSIAKPRNQAAVSLVVKNASFKTRVGKIH
jgi:hypothetical protein